VHCHHEEGPQKNSCSRSHTVLTLPLHTKDLNKSASSEEPAFVVTSCYSWVIRVVISTSWWQSHDCLFASSLSLHHVFFCVPPLQVSPTILFFKLMYCTLPGQFCNLAYGPSRVVTGVKEEEVGGNDLTESGTEDFFNMSQVLILFSRVRTTVLLKCRNYYSLLRHMK
jgi:hypothetical protein